MLYLDKIDTGNETRGEVFSSGNAIRSSEKTDVSGDSEEE